MARFSERNGFVEPRNVIQTDSLDDETRIELWDIIYLFALSVYRNRYIHEVHEHLGSVNLWNFWKRPYRELESRTSEDLITRAESTMFRGQFHEVMDLLEFFADRENFPGIEDNFGSVLNKVFENHHVGYRLVGEWIEPVTETGEVSAIEEALAATEEFAGARNHLKNALGMLSERSDPKYAKVVHESISAVEAVARHYTGEKTLGAALKKLEPSGIPAHKALTGAWSQLYGYTSDGDGIRHGSVADADVDEALATYFLVTCSAFVGYLIKKSNA